MQCFRINIRQATFIMLSIIVNNISITQMADNNSEFTKAKNNSENEQKIVMFDSTYPSNTECKNMNADCLEYSLNYSCIYGEKLNVTCSPKPTIDCIDRKPFVREMICRYCYQTEPWEHSCILKANCNSVASPPEYYITNCTVRGDILCLGNRTFNKNIKCNWTRGYRWTTALLLSITLGGFGADRFYLGRWQEGIGKLFSFGGLGVWTLIDVILISLHYLGPEDGSLYI